MDAVEISANVIISILVRQPITEHFETGDLTLTGELCTAVHVWTLNIRSSYLSLSFDVIYDTICVLKRGNKLKETFL